VHLRWASDLVAGGVNSEDEGLMKVSWGLVKFEYASTDQNDGEQYGRVSAKESMSDQSTLELVRERTNRKVEWIAFHRQRRRWRLPRE